MSIPKVLIVKTIAMLLAFNLLLTQTPLQEILKLPLLITHFEEHQQNQKKLHLVSFLKMHYSASKTADADHDKDMQLPFKKADLHFLGSIFACFTEKITIQYLISVNEPKPVPLNDANRLFPYLKAIFQPPRLS